VDHPVEPDASHHEELSPLPLGARLIVCFLGADSIERAIELGLWLRGLSAGLTTPRSSTPPNLPVLGLWIAVDLLLILLLTMRTRAGRLFTTVIFALHAFYLAHVLVLTDPTLWLYMSDWGRARLAITLALDATAILYLLSPQAAEALDHG
jgi:hypothetical protein